MSVKTPVFVTLTLPVDVAEMLIEILQDAVAVEPAAQTDVAEIEGILARWDSLDEAYALDEAWLRESRGQWSSRMDDLV